MCTIRFETQSLGPKHKWCPPVTVGSSQGSFYLASGHTVLYISFSEWRKPDLARQKIRQALGRLGDLLANDGLTFLVTVTNLSFSLCLFCPRVSVFFYFILFLSCLHCLINEEYPFLTHPPPFSQHKTAKSFSYTFHPLLPLIPPSLPPMASPSIRFST